MRWLILILFTSLLLLAFKGEAATNRSSWQVTLFKRSQPCPVTGKPAGRCPGYVVDHVIPLCAGGVDKPSNMQWQTVEAGKIKDRAERLTCKK